MQLKPRHYCTLFDSGYLSRGLAMIESLKAHSPSAKVVVFCFDARTEMVLKKLNWSHVQTVSLEQFEDADLLKVKPTRTRAEYCWTSTPATLVYCLEKLGFEDCTYLDADLFFWSDPEMIFAENPNASVFLTEHHYSPEHDQSQTSGKYCVQFMHFKKNEAGLRALHWWRDRCLEWCFNRFEDGKFGDQKYLDDWTTRFEGVHVVQSEGAGVAPWNVQKYEIHQNGKLFWLRTPTQRQDQVIFYHFHALKIHQPAQVDLCPYEIPQAARDLLYRPYVKRLSHWEKFLLTEFSFQAPRSAPLSAWTTLKRKWKGNLNYFPLEGF